MFEPDPSEWSRRRNVQESDASSEMIGAQQQASGKMLKLSVVCVCTIMARLTRDYAA